MKSISFLLALLQISCSGIYETVMPYKNLDGYSASRLFPIKTSVSDFAFRAWISNSTSIDRIVSISKDSDQNYVGTLIEIGRKYNGKKHKGYYREISIVPLSGFERFRKTIDSLRIQTITSQPCCIPVAFDSPVSSYVIEIKTKDLYNCFKFDTNYPLENSKQDVYTFIEKLLFDEFGIRKYFKFEKNGS